MRQTTGYVRHRANTDSGKVANLAGILDCQKPKGQHTRDDLNDLGANKGLSQVFR